MPPTMATDAETTAAINAHLSASHPHTQYLRQSEGDARVAVGINAHLAAADPHAQYLLQSEGDARYLRALTTTFSIDLPNMAANSLEKRFYTLAGVKIGDPALLLPINANLYANAAWPFLFAAVIEATDTVACYFRNDNITAVDLTAMQFRIVVIIF
jgi:hypothetical protein